MGRAGADRAHPVGVGAEAGRPALPGRCGAWHRRRLRHPAPAARPRGAGDHRLLARRPPLPPRLASAGVGRPPGACARTQRPGRHGSATAGRLPVARAACGDARHPQRTARGSSGSLRACGVWPRSSMCRWRAGTPPSRRMGWCWRTSCWWGRPRPGALCAAARRGRGTCCTSPAHWAARQPSWKPWRLGGKKRPTQLRRPPPPLPRTPHRGRPRAACAAASPPPPSTSATASPPTSPTCATSRKWAREIDAAALPIHPLALQASQPLQLALDGGEDYELLFAAPPGIRMPRSLAGVPITRIGRLTRGNTVTLIDANGHERALKPGGWEHFAKRR